MKLISLTESNRKGKKYKAVFSTDTGRTKTIHFGASAYQDYTQSHSKQRREAYLKRHQNKENWDVPDTAGSLSAHLLGGASTSLLKNLDSFLRKFRL
jgi:hypothetical protein